MKKILKYGANWLFKLPWLIRQTGPISIGVTRNSGAPANNLSEENPPL